MYAQSCMVITGDDLYNNKEKCFEIAISRANKAVKFPAVQLAKPFCQVIPGTQQDGKDI